MGLSLWTDWPHHLRWAVPLIPLLHPPSQAVKERLAKERELDGIDMSNIIETEGRRPRRAATAQVSYK